MINLIEASKTAERCQRNWDFSNPVAPDDIKKIVNVATTMPTKNNRAFYELTVSSNLDFNKTCYAWSINDKCDHFIDRKIHRNTQVYAPLLMIWTPPIHKVIDGFNDEFTENFYVAIGISSGAAALTANSLGYRTGYCQCFKQDKLLDTIGKKYDIKITGASNPHIVMLGIGHPDSAYDRVDCVVDGIHGYTTETRDKQIRVQYIR